ncbi:hypothetical protein CEP53_013266 [Fusarium sp. AF-6]|nr:hypothetical protein CEP53_013266 [Fusarium sp. AF-6]
MAAIGTFPGRLQPVANPAVCKRTHFQAKGVLPPEFILVCPALAYPSRQVQQRPSCINSRSLLHHLDLTTRHGCAPFLTKSRKSFARRPALLEPARGRTLPTGLPPNCLCTTNKGNDLSNIYLPVQLEPRYSGIERPAPLFQTLIRHFRSSVPIQIFETQADKNRWLTYSVPHDRQHVSESPDLRPIQAGARGQSCKCLLFLFVKHTPLHIISGLHGLGSWPLVGSNASRLQTRLLDPSISLK